ncbi:MAG: tetratricopeptide repeat protein [Fimbriimonadales bacterium]|jgi:tetratricopeptide (TPR) repeat protein|nr:tetratricopeptide repeat protein [Fimbriimonadales bacterium]GIV13637.1 MAG: hypothetical protein KatS3mg021_1919 [Fimbriimonadales bacterium]CUU01648.1 Tetratricopeptide repeat-containing protein [Armatimonadetes bacterium GBS]CUU35547.1 Tetratricopeptide repeat-containing protein [Armatimonadetes bacterium GXS]
MRRLWLWMLAWGLMLGFVWAQNTLTPDLQKQFDRAVQLARAGKLKEAEPILRSILHKRPQFVPAHINLGLVYRLQNQYDKAAYHFRTAAKLNPKDPLPLLELTRMALDRGKLDDAEGYLRTLRQRHPNHPEVAVLSGSLAMLRGQWKEAQAEFQKAFRTRPNDFRIVYNLGVIAYQLENFPEAQRYMERTVQLKPDYTTAWKSLGMVYEALNRPADAIRAYTEALKREPDDLPTRLKRAMLYQRENRTDEALQDYLHLTKVYPRNPEALIGAGMLLMRQEKWESAKHYLGRAIQLFRSNEPIYWDILTEIAICELRLKNYGKAREYFGEILKLFPRNQRAYEGQYEVLQAQGENDQEILPFLRRWEENLPDDYRPTMLIAAIYERSQQFELANAEYQKLLQKHPKNSDLRREYARFLSRNGRETEALQIYDALLSESPSEVSALLGKARIMERQQKFQEALALYQQVLSRDPTNEIALLGAAAMHRKLNQIDEAAQIYRQMALGETLNMLALSSMIEMLRAANRPDDLIAFLKEVVAKHGVEHLPLLATELARLNRIEEAVQAYREAIAKDPQDPRLYRGLGALLEQLQRYDEALQAYQHALQLDPKNAWTVGHLAQVLINQEKYAEAWEVLRNGLLANPDEITLYGMIERLTEKLGRQAEYESLLQGLASKSTPAQEPVKAYAEWMRRQGRLNEAIAFVEARHKAEPENAPLLQTLVNLYTAAKRYPEALEAYARLAQVQPKDVFSLRSWATLADQHGTLEQRIRAYEALYKAVPDEITTGLKLARLYQQNGQRQKAIDLLSKMQSDFPKNEDIQRLLNEIIASR